MAKQRINTPFSTISYNSPAFLDTRLNEMLIAKDIRFAMWIYHKAEKDEAKDHIHLYIEPKGSCDPDSLLSELSEFDPTHPDKPLGCLPWRKSKTDDWLLYAIHNPDYLWTKKRQKREFHYQFNAIHNTDPFFFGELVNNIDYRWRDSIELADRLAHGQDLTDLVFRGYINLGNACQAKAFSYFVRRQSHTPTPEFVVDKDGQVRAKACSSDDPVSRAFDEAWED